MQPDLIIEMQYASNLKSNKDNLLYHLKFAEQGVLKAQYNVAQIYDSMSNPSLAIKWYKESASKGYLESQKLLARMYSNDFYVEEDECEAYYWCRRAAEQGDIESQFILGDYYYNGYGVSQSYEKARYWYMLAAEKGHKGAIYNLWLLENELKDLKKQKAGE